MRQLIPRIPLMACVSGEQHGWSSHVHMQIKLIDASSLRTRPTRSSRASIKQRRQELR